MSVLTNDNHFDSSFIRAKSVDAFASVDPSVISIGIPDL